MKGGGGCQGGFVYIYNILLRDPSKVGLGTTCSRVNQEMTFKIAEFGRIFFEFGACYKVF